MKLTCDREKLSSAFQLAAGVTPTRSPKPILENVKLEVAQDSATLMATDLEVGLRVELLGLEVEAAGTAVLPIKRVGSILRESPDEKLHLESDGAKLRVHGQRSEFHLPMQNPDEFPTVQSFDAEKYHKLPARLLREIFRRTAFATDTESSRYALGGVLVELSSEGIIGVGTDGRRLARQQAPAESVAGHQTEAGTVVPSRAVQLIERALGDSEDEVLLAARENDVLVKCGHTTIYTRLVEGRYPRWRDVFPDYGQMPKIEITVGPFYSAVRQAAIVTSEERRGVDFCFADGRLELTGHGAEFGESRVELPVAYEGPEVTVKLDPRFVADFLKVLNLEQTFSLHLRDAQSAVVCTTDDGYGYVIMPLSQEQ